MKEIDTEKIRSLLEKAIRCTTDNAPLKKILSLLPPPCERCGGEKHIPSWPVMIPCPACQVPAAGKVEEFLALLQKERNCWSEHNSTGQIIEKACIHLTAQAKQIEERYGKGWRDGSDAQDKADHEHIIKPLEAKIERLETEQCWIPVSERLPENIKDVLSLRFSTCDRAYYDKETQNWYTGSTNACLNKVTHWKPIILPQEKGN